MNRHFRSQVRLSCDGKLTRNRANSNFHPQPAIVIIAPICRFSGETVTRNRDEITIAWAAKNKRWLFSMKVLWLEYHSWLDACTCQKQIKAGSPWFEFLVIFDFFAPWYGRSEEASSVKISLKNAKEQLVKCTTEVAWLLKVSIQSCTQNRRSPKVQSRLGDWT